MIIGIDARLYGAHHRGIGRYTERLITHLVDQLTADDRLILFLDQRGMEECQITDQRVSKVLAPYRAYSRQEQLLLPRLIAKQGVDLMHFTHFNVPLSYRGRYVVTVHDLIISNYPDSRATTRSIFIYKLKLWLYQLVLQHALKVAERIITVSNYSRQDIIKFFPTVKDKIVVTYEGVDPIAAGAMNETVLAQYKITKPYLLYVGAAYPHKNLDRLVAAFKIVNHNNPNVSLVLAGRHDFFYQRLIEQIKEQGIENIILPGFVPDQDLVALYQNATAYVFPSLLEGFGLPPLEAQAYGTLVVSSDRSSLPEVLGAGAIYFDPTDIEAIAQTLIKVADQNNNFDRQAVIERGTANVLRFSWQKMAGETHDVYRSLKKSSG